MGRRESGGIASWTLAELSEETGIPGRTIRFYISRGLLAGPAQSGREAFYEPKHRERLDDILRLQAEGLSLQEIGIRLNGPEKMPLTRPETILRFSIGAHVAVEVRPGLPPWHMKQIQTAIAEFAAHIAAADQEKQANAEDDEL